MKGQMFRYKLDDILLAVSWADISRHYFGKTSSWIYKKMDAKEGDPDGFTEEERALLKGALCDLADRLRRVSDSL